MIARTWILKILILLCPGVGFAQAGKAGLSFLKLGVDGRSSAMADAMTAGTFGAAATYYNPSGLLNLRDGNPQTQLIITHREWIQDTRSEVLAASVMLDDYNAIGFSLNTTSIADIEIRTRPGDAEGTFTARNYSLGVSYARAFSETFRAGATVRFLYEKILIDEASGFALDVGGQLATPIQGLHVGAVLANLGSLNKLRSEETTLPALLRIGPEYAFVMETTPLNISVASDLVHVFPEGETYINAGVEMEFSRSIAARGGYQFGSTGRGLSTGLGVRYAIFGVDYAYAPLSNDLGNSHTISLVIHF